MEAIETAVRHQALRVAARAVERRLNEDHSDQCRGEFACHCGRPAQYAGRRAKGFTSVLGRMRLERAYYYCAVCHEGFAPRDRALGIEETSLSPALTRMTGLVGSMVSFEEGSELLAQLAGIKLNAKHVERSAEALGRQIAEDERRHVLPAAADQIAPTLLLGMDGTGAPMRSSEVAGREGKQPDGSAKTREVKICTIWSAEGRDEEGVPVRDPGSVTYSAAIESAATLDTDKVPSPFAQRVVREATRRGFDLAIRRVVLGDGAPWIWNLATEHFPDAIQIVDRFHVKQHLSELAKAILGTAGQAARTWAGLRHDELDEGRLDDLLGAIEPYVCDNEEARKCHGYITENRKRMNYPDFHAQGLCTSTGVVEAGCRVVVGTRLKRAGMHWTVRGADAIIALRCSRLSGRFEDFWERRSKCAA